MIRDESKIIFTQKINREEMKNKISIALKDPILQQGFDIICKENAELKETLTVGTTWNKHLNSRNKALEEESDKYRNMVFDKIEQLTKAKEIIKGLLNIKKIVTDDKDYEVLAKAEQFISGVKE